MNTVEIIDNTGKFKENLADKIPVALEAVGQQAEGYAKLLCPVDTGNLRNSITHRQEGNDTEVIGTNVEYAPYVELGTRNMKAQPYLRPAAADHTPEYVEIMKAYLAQ